jgi:hypothetical protein
MEHYWPGASVTIPWLEDYDTRAYDDLPFTFPADPNNPSATPGAYEKGYDAGIPTPDQGLGQKPSGAYPTVFNIVGEGREVTFIATSHTPDSYYVANGGHIADYGEAGSLGIYMMLMVPGYQSNLHQGWPQGWVADASGSYLGKYDQTAAITWFLNEGETYYLSIGSYLGYEVRYTDITDPQGNPQHPGWVAAGQMFHVDFRYTQRYSNDRRASAADVIITADNGVYQTVPAGIVNDTLTVDRSFLPNSLGVGGSYPDDQPDGQGDYTAWWVYQPASDGTFNALLTIEPENFPYGYMMIYRENPDGSLVLLNTTWNIDITATANTRYFISLSAYIYFKSPGQIYHLRVQGKKSVVQAPLPIARNPNKYRPPVKDPVWTDPGALPVDKFDPGVTQPADLDSGEDTLLNLVRAFSSAVRRAVRITGPTTIEMVDPATPLPAGWAAADAKSLYHSASTANAATDVVLSTSAGAVTVTGSADLVADDVRLVRSTWRIPDRLPFYGLPPSPVQRVTLTFTPQGFRASVDFHFAAVPFAARRP